MIKCKCLYDRKSLSIYAIVGSIIAITILAIHGAIFFTLPVWVDANFVVFLLSGVALFGISGFMLLLAAFCISVFCKNDPPRDHGYIVWASIFVGATMILLAILLPHFIGGYINLYIFNEMRADVHSYWLWDNISSFKDSYKPLDISHVNVNCQDIKFQNIFKSQWENDMPVLRVDFNNQLLNVPYEIPQSCK